VVCLSLCIKSSFYVSSVHMSQFESFVQVSQHESVPLLLQFVFLYLRTMHYDTAKTGQCDQNKLFVCRYPVQAGDTIWMAPFVPQWCSFWTKTCVKYDSACLLSDVCRTFHDLERKSSTVCSSAWFPILQILSSCTDTHCAYNFQTNVW
jgi:hypothetical protein